MSICVGVLFEVFLAGPVAEVSEGDMSFFVVMLEKSFESGLRIMKLDTPSSQFFLAVYELNLTDPTFSVNIELFELEPEVVVLLEIDEEVSELSLADIVVSE